MDVQVLVTTADLFPIQGALVMLEGDSSRHYTDPAGTALIHFGSVPFVVNVSKPNYNDRSITVSTFDPSRQWDDPGTTFRPVSGPALASSQVVMEVRLGRLSFSPTVPLDEAARSLFRIPDNVFKAFPLNEYKRKYNPGWARKLQHAFTKVQSGNTTYSFIGTDYVPENFNFWDVNFWGAMERDMLGDRKGKGWAAFNNPRSLVVKPQNDGNFMLVEWTSPATPIASQGGTNPEQECAPQGLDRYLVGLWRPRSSVVPGSTVDGTVVSRDVVVFFPPTTGPRVWPSDRSPYRCDYPYSLNQYVDDNPKNDLQVLGQRYVEVLPTYLFRSHFLAHAILAAQRDALLVIPIQPAGHWGNLTDVGGLSRLISEALLFEHRQHPLPDSPNSRSVDTAPSRNDRGGVIERLTTATHVSVPPLGRVVVAGFSAGVGAVRSLLNSAKTPLVRRTWDAERNDPYRADPSGFLASWREIWDLDGSATVLDPGYFKDKPWTGDYLGTFGALLRDWQQRGGTQLSSDPKLVRAYHTSITTLDASKMRLLNKILGNKNVKSAWPDVRAMESNSDEGSWVWFANDYLSKNSPPGGSWLQGESKATGSPGRPEFWIKDDAHQAVPDVCFAHAVANSKLRKLVF